MALHDQVLHDQLQGSLDRLRLRDLIAFVSLVANAIERGEDWPESDHVKQWGLLAHAWLKNRPLDEFSWTFVRRASDKLIAYVRNIKG